MIFLHMFLEQFNGTFFIKSNDIESLNETFYGSVLALLSDALKGQPFALEYAPLFLALSFILISFYRATFVTNNFSAFTKINTSNPILVTVFLYLISSFLFNPTTINVVKLGDRGTVDRDTLTIIEQIEVPRIISLPATISNSFIYGVSYTLDDKQKGDTYHRNENDATGLHFGMLFSGNLFSEANTNLNWNYYPKVLSVKELDSLRTFYSALGKTYIDENSNKKPDLPITTDTRALLAASGARDWMIENRFNDNTLLIHKKDKNPINDKYNVTEPFESLTNILSASQSAAIGLAKLGMYVGADVDKYKNQELYPKTFFLPSVGYIRQLDDENKKSVCETLGVKSNWTTVHSPANPFFYQHYWDSYLKTECSTLTGATPDTLNGFLNELKTKASTKAKEIANLMPTTQLTATPLKSPITIDPIYYHALLPSIPNDIKEEKPALITSTSYNLYSVPSYTIDTVKIEDNNLRKIKYIFASSHATHFNTNGAIDLKITSEQNPSSHPTDLLKNIKFNTILDALKDKITTDNPSPAGYDAVLSYLLLLGDDKRLDRIGMKGVNRGDFLRNVFYNSMISYALLKDEFNPKNINLKGLKTKEDLYKNFKNSSTIDLKQLSVDARQGIKDFYKKDSANKQSYDPSDLLATTMHYSLFEQFERLLSMQSQNSTDINPCKNAIECNSIVFNAVMEQIATDNFLSKIELAIYTNNKCLNTNETCATTDNVSIYDDNNLSSSSFITPRIIPYIAYRLFAQNRTFTQHSLSIPSDTDIATVKSYLCNKSSFMVSSNEICDENNTTDIFTFLNKIPVDKKDEVDAKFEDFSAGSAVSALVSGVSDFIIGFISILVDIFQPFISYAYNLFNDIPFISDGKIWINDFVVNLVNIFEVGSLKVLSSPIASPEPSSFSYSTKLNESDVYDISSYLDLAVTKNNNLITPYTNNSSLPKYNCAEGFWGGSTITSLSGGSNCRNIIQFPAMIIQPNTPFLFYSGNPSINAADKIRASYFQETYHDTGEELNPLKLNSPSIYNDLFTKDELNFVQEVPSDKLGPIATLTANYSAFTGEIKNLSLQNSKDSSAYNWMLAGVAYNTVQTVGSAVGVGLLYKGVNGVLSFGKYTLDATSKAFTKSGRQLLKNNFTKLKANGGLRGELLKPVSRSAWNAIKSVPKTKLFTLSAFYGLFDFLSDMFSKFVPIIIAFLALFILIILSFIFIEILIFYTLIRMFISFTKAILSKYAIPMVFHFVQLFFSIFKYMFDLFKPSNSTTIASLFEKTFEQSFFDSLIQFFKASFLLSLIIFIFNITFDFLWSNLASQAALSAWLNGLPGAFETVFAGTLALAFLLSSVVISYLGLLSPKQTSLKDMINQFRHQ